uniref:Galanin receptor type 3-like n=1 Tax=Lepisosteus oculatus TaxID=7918 RepID=W5NNF1_LEPOC
NLLLCLVSQMENVTFTPGLLQTLQVSNSTPGPSLTRSYVVVSQVVRATWYVVIFVLGVASNLLLLLALLHSLREGGASPLHSMTSLLILNSVLADTIFVLYNVPLSFAQSIWWDPRFITAACISSQPVTSLVIFVSFYSMVANCVFRFLGVAHPTSSRGLRRWHMGLSLGVVWLASILTSLPVCFYIRVADVNGTISCVQVMTKAQAILYTILLGAVAFCPAVLLMVALYSKMIHILWSRKGGGGNVRQNKRATVMILTALLAFIVMWIPFWVLIFVVAAAQELQSSPTLIFALGVLALLASSNCFVNPLIYLILSPHYRRRLARMFGC